MSNPTPHITFSILHTSARPDKWREIYEEWIGSAKCSDFVEYILVIDHDWGFTDEIKSAIEQLFHITGRSQDKVLWAKGSRHCYVDGVNTAASASTGKVLIVNADDQYPCPHWDEELLTAIGDRSMDTDFIILPSTGTPDEHIRRIAVMPVLSRTRYLRNGYVLFPAYESMFSDNDFLAHARHDGVVIEAKHLLFPHRHPLADPTIPQDAAYLAQNRPDAYSIGNAVYEARLSTKFGSATGAGTSFIQSVNALRPRLVMCVPGETFCSEWVAQWSEIIGQLSQFYEVLPLFGYCSNVFATRNCMNEAVASMKPDFVVWIDDDNIVAPGQIATLLCHIIQGQDVDVVAGWCWLQTNMYTVKDRVSVGYFAGERAEIHRYADLHSHPTDLIPVDWTGFPVVAMRGDVVKRMGDNPFLPIRSPHYPGGQSGEDIGWCWNAKNAGINIYVDRTVKVPHMKRKPDEPGIPLTPEQTVEHSTASLPVPEFAMTPGNSIATGNF